jgi:hypothetical protein
MSYTYVILRVSPEAFAEIEDKIIEAGYGHVFHPDPDRDRSKLVTKPVMDMHGIAIGIESE